jgi:hypothetical protein
MLHIFRREWVSSELIESAWGAQIEEELAPIIAKLEDNVRGNTRIDYGMYQCSDREHCQKRDREAILMLDCANHGAYVRIDHIGARIPHSDGATYILTSDLIRLRLTSYLLSKGNYVRSEHPEMKQLEVKHVKNRGT